MKIVELDKIDITSEIKKQYELGGWKFTGKIRAGIYKIVNVTTGKYYVGSSKNINHRLLYHHYRTLLMNTHFNNHLQNAWNKYGENSFKFYVVKEMFLPTTNSILLKEEQIFLDVANSDRENCYNKTFIAGRVEMTDEMRNKIGDSVRKWIQINGHSRKGTHPTPKTLRRMSMSQTGKKRSSIAIEKISGERSVAHRDDVKEKKRKWWDNLKKDPIAYAEFCKARAIKSVKSRYERKCAKNYEIISD